MPILTRRLLRDQSRREAQTVSTTVEKWNTLNNIWKTDLDFENRVIHREAQNAKRYQADSNE